MTLLKKIYHPKSRAIAKRLFGRITELRHIDTKTMHNPNKYGESLRNPSLLVASAAALAGAVILRDYYKGGIENASLRTETELLTNEVIDAEHTVVWFVGCMQDGKDAFEELTPITKGVNLIVPRLPQTSQDGRIDQLDMCKKVADQLIATRAKQPVLIGDSRGGLDANALVQYIDYMGLTDAIGGFGKLIYNASPHDGNDITDSRKRLLVGARMLQHFSTPNRIKPRLMRMAGHESSARATLSETVLAGRNIQQAPAVSPLPAVFQELVYVRGQHPDPTVRTHEAAEKFHLDAPSGLFSEYIDNSRKPGAHIGDEERYHVLLGIAGIATDEIIDSSPEEEVIHFNHHQLAA